MTLDETHEDYSHSFGFDFAGICIYPILFVTHKSLSILRSEGWMSALQGVSGGKGGKKFLFAVYCAAVSKSKGHYYLGHKSQRFMYIIFNISSKLMYTTQFIDWSMSKLCIMNNVPLFPGLTSDYGLPFRMAAKL